MFFDYARAVVTWPFFWPIAIVGGFFLLLFLVSVFERRPTNPYVPVRAGGGPPPPPAGPGQAPQLLPYSDNTPDSSELPEYVRIMSDDAYTAGFVFDRLLSHVKAPKIKILATAFMSRDRRTIFVSGAGTVMGMPTSQTWLMSPLTDGSWLVTTDNNDEGDRSGLYRVKRVIRCRFDKVLAAHQKRLEKFGPQVTTFREANAFEALTGIYARRADHMVSRGIARHGDPERLHWHYTAWGGALNCLHFFTQLAQTLPQAWRVNKKPVGGHVVLPLGQSVYERYRVPGSPPPLPVRGPGRVDAV